MNAATRERLLERCQQERYELLAMASSAAALAPRARTWLHAARTFFRLLRVLAARARRATQ
jgi:hypothetical protein